MTASPDRIFNIIAVDANPRDYAALAEAAHETPLRLCLATTGERALKLAQGLGDGLWLVNLRLADTSGLELLAVVRQRQPNTPIVLVGDEYAARDELAARAAGATAYLCKPVLPEWLRYGRCLVKDRTIRAGPIRAPSAPTRAT